LKGEVSGNNGNRRPPPGKKLSEKKRVAGNQLNLDRGHWVAPTRNGNSKAWEQGRALNWGGFVCLFVKRPTIFLGVRGAKLVLGKKNEFWAHKSKEVGKILKDYWRWGEKESWFFFQRRDTLFGVLFKEKA